VLFSVGGENYANIIEYEESGQVISNKHQGSKRQAGMPVLLNYLGEFFEVIYEAMMFKAAGFIIWRAQD
jgi:hypothetical protein